MGRNATAIFGHESKRPTQALPSQGLVESDADYRVGKTGKGSVARGDGRYARIQLLMLDDTRRRRSSRPPRDSRRALWPPIDDHHQPNPRRQMADTLQKSVDGLCGQDSLRRRAMMGRLKQGQGQFFYSFWLDEVIPHDRRIREIAGVLDLSWVHAELGPYYSQPARPSIDPVLVIRMLIVGYVFAIRWERLLCREVKVNREIHGSENDRAFER
jgi:hypothetical protein